MDYEVEPRGIGSPRRRAAVLAVLATSVLVAIVALGALGERRPATLTIAPAPTAVSPGWAARLPEPRALDCASIRRRDCLDALAAARLAIGPLEPLALRVTLQRSLVCGDGEDCPHPFLADSTPVGAVIVDFDDGLSAWVNVVRPLDAAEPVRARVVRWTETALRSPSPPVRSPRPRRRVRAGTRAVPPPAAGRSGGGAGRRPGAAGRAPEPPA